MWGAAKTATLIIERVWKAVVGYRRGEVVDCHDVVQRAGCYW